ncbi:MAG: NAD-binding protein [Clostridia bacterium]|nr:NAD-binding protein [Clostridia bacterium]
MIVVLQKVFNKLKKRISLSSVGKIIVMVIGLVMLVAYLFYLFESKINTDLSYADAIWWGFVTVTTVGYGDIPVLTLGGKIVATFLMLIGIGSFGLITASVATIFIDKMFKGESGKMKVNVKNHIVIFGWNNKTRNIIEEIKNEDITNEILVVTNKKDMKKPKIDIHYVNGEETDDITLDHANIQYASKVIVLSDETLDSPQMQDAKSVLICLAVDKINTDIHIVAEIADESNINHFKRANVDDYIITNQIASKIIARGAMHKHVSEAIKELTTNSFGNELYEKEINGLVQPIAFSELSKMYLDQHQSILIGIVKEGKTIINPSTDMLVSNKDSIIYISQEAI